MDYADPQDSGYGDDDSTPSSLHPDRFDHDHISKLEVFSQDLQKAISNSFPRPNTSYTSVHVLLLRWAEDDLNVQDELTLLKDVFENQYQFATEQWDIPSQNPTRALQTKLYEFQNCHQCEDELLIVYYGGHGDADRRRGRSIWAANRKPDSPTLTWSSLQHLLETAIPHVLIILDCCYAANAARDTSEGTTKELLAACGRENPTLGVGIRSFTSAIVEELQAFGRSPFTVAMLHSRLITMRWRLAYTPVYALLSEHGGHSIELAPLSALTQTGKSSDEDDSGFDEDMMDISTPEARVATDTRVLLSVSISDDAACDIAEWKKWLVTQAPVEVTKVEVKVEAVFKSHSTMLIISLPIMAWNCLPNKAAYRFVGFVKSGNLDQTHLEVERDNGRLAATVSSQQGDKRLVKKQLQLFESRTLSTSEELSKERDAARDSLSEIQQSMKATKSNLLAQQEVAAQRQVLLERKEQEWANEKRTMEAKVHVAEKRLAALLEHQSTEGKTSALAPKDMKEFPIDSRPMNVSKFHPKPDSPKHTSIQARALNSFEPLPPTTNIIPPDIKASPKSGLLQSSHHGDSALQNFQNAGSTAQAGSAMASTLQTAGWAPPGSKDDFPIKTERTCSPLHDTSGIHDEATAGKSPIEAKTTTPRPSIIFKEEQWTGAKPLQGEEFSDMNETKTDIWFDKVMKEEAATSPAKQLNYSPWSKEHVPTSLEISQKEKSTSGTFDFASSPQSTQWTNEMDLQLQQARQQGHNWATIAKSYFPSRTADACRKRHEKVMANRRNEYTKFELLATLYAHLREYTWSKLALAAGEHWSVVEAKCMGNGLEILLSTARVRQHSAPPSKADASSYDHLGDSAIGLDDESTELSGQRNVTPSINDFGSYETPTKFEVEEDFSSKMEWRSVISNPGDLGPESSSSTGPQSMPMQSINQIRKKRRRTTPEEATHACRICGELFKRSYDWKAHMKTHNGPPMPNDSSGKPREARSPRRTRSSRKRQDIQLNDISEEGHEEDKETTRCICGQQSYPGVCIASNDPTSGHSQNTDDLIVVTLWEDIGSFFIQCDSCRVWQHGGCVGIMDETITPEEYFCEQCRSDLHMITTTTRVQRFSRYLPMQYILPPQSPTTPMQGGFPKDPNESYWSGNNTQSLSRDAASHEAEVLRQPIEESKRESTSAESSTSRKGKRSREEDEDDPRDFALFEKE